MNNMNRGINKSMKNENREIAKDLFQGNPEMYKILIAKMCWPTRQIT